MIFIDNKYTRWYYQIINSAKTKDRTRRVGDGLQTHHIVPRALGGSDHRDNLVVLEYREHKICHRLLIKMLTGHGKYKMMYAYKLFQHDYPTPCPHKMGYYTADSARKMVATRKAAGTYYIGKDNNFSKPEMRELVRERMKNTNPMSEENQRERMRQKNNNPFVKTVQVNGLTFPSINAAARYFGTTAHLFKRDYEYTLISG